MAVRPVVKYIKLGDFFEVEFQDTIDQSDKKGYEFIEKVVTYAFNYLNAQADNIPSTVVKINAGPEYYIGYSERDPSQFSFYITARSKETKWYLHPGTKMNAHIICTAYGHSNDNVGYHWAYESGKKPKIALHENFPGFESTTSSMFYIDHNVPTLIRPYNAPDMKVIAYPESGTPPPPKVPFETVDVVKLQSYGDVDLTVQSM